jgi:hypothetical protein
MPTMTTIIRSSGSSCPRTTSAMGVLNPVSSSIVGNFTYVCILTLSRTFACSTVVHTGRHTTSAECGIWGSHISVVVYVIGREVADVLETSATTPNDAAYTAQDLDASLRTYVSAIFRYVSPFCSQCCEGCGLRRQVCKYNATAICKLAAMQLKSPFFWDMRRVIG